MAELRSGGVVRASHKRSLLFPNNGKYNELNLLKVPIVGENLSQSFPAHGWHRDAKRQAVAFVGGIG